MKRSWIFALLLAGGLAAQGAHASFIFTIERLSDTQARITGSGSSDGDHDFIPLDGVLTGPLGGITLGTNTLDVGSANVDGVLLSLSGKDIELEFDAFFYNGDVASGSILLTVDGGNKWVPVGSTGSNGREDTWSMVPEPGSLALLGLGLAGIGAARRRKLAA